MNHKGSAIVYNPFLRELGGGERSTLAYASALQRLGYRTEVLTADPVPSRETLTRHFGEEFADIEVRTVSDSGALSEIRRPDLAVFVNHAFLSFIPNPAPIGIYALMFPVHTLDNQANASEVDALSTYQWILCNSDFTLRHTQSRWRDVRAPLAALLPPTSRDCTKMAQSLIGSLPRKSRQIVHIGRFNPILHSKNQHLIIESFLEAAERYPELSDWRLVLIGTVTTALRSREYFERCVGMAGNRVTVLANAPSDALSRVLLESFAYVHATGAFSASEQQPDCCEHLGLSIVEAMAHACIPIVYGHGGIWDFVGDDNGLIAYRTPSELIDAYRQLPALYEAGADRLQTHNLTQAASLNADSFREKLEGFLNRAGTL
jgi:glycosyltransferase involved in cell wall biosynthesis